MHTNKFSRIRTVRTWCFRILCVVMVLAMNAGTVSALTGAQKSIMDANIRRFDIESDVFCGASGGESIDTAADMLERAKTAFKYLLAHGGNSKFTPPGYTPEQVAGIVGNLMWESHVDPKAVEGGSGEGYGIAQWSFGRKTLMRTWVSAQPAPNNDPTALGGQLDFLIHELHTTEASADRGLRQQDSINSATSTYMNLFERPASATANLTTRIKYAHTVYDAVKADGGFTSGEGTEGELGASDSNCTSGGGTSSVECNGAAGNAKILCEAHKYQGIYYRWGGGHQGVDAFHQGCPDPSNPPNNQPHGSSAATHNGNPSPCATDCSGLVSIAVAEALGGKAVWNVSSMQRDAAHWRQITMAQAKAGDIVTKGSYHVEIVDHISGSTAYTFGSHQTGTKTGPSSGRYDAAYHYIGPGSGP